MLPINVDSGRPSHRKRSRHPDCKSPRHERRVRKFDLPARNGDRGRVKHDVFAVFKVLVDQKWLRDKAPSGLHELNGCRIVIWLDDHLE